MCNAKVSPWEIPNFGRVAQRWCACPLTSKYCLWQVRWRLGNIYSTNCVLFFFKVKVAEKLCRWKIHTEPLSVKTSLSQWKRVVHQHKAGNEWVPWPTNSLSTKFNWNLWRMQFRIQCTTNASDGDSNGENEQEVPKFIAIMTHHVLRSPAQSQLWRLGTRYSYRTVTCLDCEMEPAVS